MTQAVKKIGTLLLVAAVAFPITATAGEDEEQEIESERREAVRSAVEQGHIKPLSELLKEIQKHLPGKVLGVEAEKKEKRWIYEFRVIDASGRLYEVSVDAATAEILKIEQE
ncbi:PepSY domain-containing protein [Hyphomicrobium denitrificans]|nr:PepSY domain-containing protein [Hyphomicrobium denitrificans]